MVQTALDYKEKKTVRCALAADLCFRKRSVHLRQALVFASFGYGPQPCMKASSPPLAFEEARRRGSRRQAATRTDEEGRLEKYYNGRR